MIDNIQLRNLGTVNKNEVTIEYSDKNGDSRKIDLIFSYQTIVGLRYNWKTYCRQND